MKKIIKKTTRFFADINLSTKITLVGLALTASCAHEVTPVQLPPSANPTAELEILKNERAEALNRQTDVLAPSHFTKAESYYKEAQEDFEKKADREKTLKAISYSKAYLMKAEESAAKARSDLKDIMDARKAAINAGATGLPDQLGKVDRDLKSATSDMESGSSIKPKQIANLQQQYMDLELASIKSAKLSEAKNNLTLATQRGALKIVPKSMAMAQQKYNTAEKIIETDRGNYAEVNNASAEATAAGQRVLKLLNNVQSMKNQSPEQTAMVLESRDQAIVDADSAAESAMLNSQNKSQQLNKQRTELNLSEQENANLKKKDSMNQILENARMQFSKEEADIYRQGSHLIIRLKSIEFPSGRSDLPAKSLVSLNKVKDVIGNIGSDNVVIEGHTDAVGSAEVNKTLSEKRAESVAQFFITSKSVDSDHIKSVGYGFEKPLATNKTKSGRAQNRRVDIVISPITALE